MPAMVNGRPERGVPCMYLILPEQARRLAQAALDRDTSMSALVREAIDDLFVKLKVKP
jgi:hypothetical protein